MRRWLLHESHLSVLTAKAREAAIVTNPQRQATTASRNTWVRRCLKQDPTHLPDATSSLKRRTRKCSFREKTILACRSALGRWSSATQTGGSAAWCVQSTRHGKNHHWCSAVPPARESSEEHAQLVESTRSAEVRSRTMYPRIVHCALCIGSFSLHSKWIGLSKRDPNSSVLRRDVESDRPIGNDRSQKYCKEWQQ